MKKLFTILALACVSVAGMAQNSDNTVPTDKYSVATNSFWSNWFIQANYVGTAFYGDQEHGTGLDLAKSPFKGFRNNLGFSVAVGKWFTPGLGLRTKFNGIWGRSVVSDNKETNANKYWMLNEQVMFNLSNLICGYSETRVWNLIPYLGAGVARNMSYDTYAANLGLGILNEFRLCKKVAINLDLAWNVLEPTSDGVVGFGNCTGPLKTHDQQFAVEVGLTYNLGKATWSKAPDVEALRALSQAQIDALNAQLADAQAENERVKTLVAKQQQPTNEVQTVKEIVAAPVSVFFNIGKSKIASRKDIQNVKDLVEVAKANNSKIVVTGYADSKTGSASFNQTLSEKRANTVVNELVKMGVNRDNIEVKAAGGVNTLSPISYNRRATVAIK